MNLTYTLLQMINAIKNKNVIIATNDNLCLKMSVILVISITLISAQFVHFI